MPDELSRRGRRVMGQEPGEMAEPQPVDMADLLTLDDRVAIVGGAGCGKTTYLSFVAASLAAALAGQPLDTRLKPRYPDEPLPIPLVAPLRYWKAYRDACADRRERILDHPETGTLAGFLLWYLRYWYKNFEAAGDFFDRLLKGQGCLIMLDGLDEVVSVSDRRVVRDAVSRLLDTQYPGNPCLLDTQYPGNPCLVTAREAGYRDAPFGEEFQLCKVQPMTEKQIADLVGAWCAQIWPQKADCDAACDELLRAITALNEERVERGQEPLVATPLMVTMVVSVKYSRRELPRERAKLYDACVDVVLESQYTGYEDEAGARRAVVDWGGPPDKQREWLSQLAFEMHQQGAAGATADENQVRAVLSPLLERRGELPLLERFIAAVRGRGGLFEERGDRFQFMHLTFQEFLAAQHLARQWAALPDPAGFLAQVVTDEWWREALLLTVGSLGAPVPYEQREAFVTALWELPGSPEARLAAAELCATGLLDLTEPEPKLLDTARQRLAALTTDSAFLNRVTPPRRAAGRALAKLGDLRPGVGVISPSPAEREGMGGAGLASSLPDIVWCYVPAGSFLMGSADGYKMAYDDEKPQHAQDIPYGYLISRYPITNAQFGAFVEAGGYRERRYWPEAERAGVWKDGLVKARLDDEPRADPYDFGEPFNLANHPVVGVTWYEALAFCRWLGEKVSESANQRIDEWRIWRKRRLERLGNSLDDGLRTAIRHSQFVIRLPTEAEWEKAARGGPGVGVRVFPWGNEPDPERANYEDTGIGTTSAVGCFPGGARPYGVEDLSGNVWEWCHSLYKPYPYRVDGGREDPRAEGGRVLRGGAFSDVARLVRCASRYWDEPYYRLRNRGFRVVVAPGFTSGRW